MGNDEGMPIQPAVPWSILRTDRRATTALEYALVASLVGVVITMALEMTGHHLDRVLESIATNL
jgi:Flp pilus assembly pilin Flp